MEQNKYYTPTLEEFYVGYECETEDFIGSGFYPLKITTDVYSVNYNGVLNKDNMFLFRTKYLDEQDIIDLGFEKIDTYFILTKSFNNEFSNKQIVKYEINLNRNYYSIENNELKQNSGICIYMNGFGNIHPIYIGECKSKNELRKILNFLNITK